MPCNLTIRSYMWIMQTYIRRFKYMKLKPKNSGTKQRYRGDKTSRFTNGILRIIIDTSFVKSVLNKRLRIDAFFLKKKKNVSSL